MISCNTNKKFAKEFVRHENLPHILFISFPDIITKFVPSDFDIDSNLAYMPPKIHSMLTDSQIADYKLKYDSVFAASSLKAGFNFYKVDSLTQFFDKSAYGWQLNLAQITIEEHRFQYWDQANYSNFTVSFDTIISFYEFNVWYELIPVNNDTAKPVVLFATEFLQDNIRGKFVYNRQTGIYVYQYEFEEVNANDIAGLITNSADIHADYLFDYFLNVYLVSNKKINDNTFLSYDRNRNKILNSNRKRFYIIDK